MPVTTTRRFGLFFDIAENHQTKNQEQRAHDQPIRASRGGIKSHVVPRWTHADAGSMASKNGLGNSPERDAQSQ
jgi:hypothetical protein